MEMSLDFIFRVISKCFLQFQVERSMISKQLLLLICEG